MQGTWHIPLTPYKFDSKRDLRLIFAREHLMNSLVRRQYVRMGQVLMKILWYAIFYSGIVMMLTSGSSITEPCNETLCYRRILLHLECEK